MDDRRGLLKDALVKFTAGIILIGLLIFLPAWDIKWREGWLFMGLLFIPMCIAGVVMYLKAPDLLRSRLRNKESQGEQKTVIRLSGLMFVAAFVAAGLNHRFGWMKFPRSMVISGCVVFLCAYIMFAEVLRENAYLSRVIEVQEGQKVVDTGLYAVVRHPMYSATVFLFLSMALILDSPISFIIMLLYIPMIAVRAVNEEKVLEKELEGYTEYEKKVRYRIIPYIW
ncbi:MAG: isoprenylcysteine carboxylmethyltransferase family protein [Oscillospiraceae bacterium]|nr:isoprenylcysteine carboxylmethyltransferase family protein [Oscillospiraceae bacterium]